MKNGQSLKRPQRWLRAALWILLAQAALVLGLSVTLRSGVFPLGVRGEWEWQRLTVDSTALGLMIAFAGVLAYSAFAALGMQLLGDRPSRLAEGLAVVGLTLAAVVMLAVVPTGAPEGYGLAKWSLGLWVPGATGYFKVAHDSIDDPWGFLRDYPEWIKRQDSLHVGTHPPGLFVAEMVLLHAMRSQPEAARWVVDHVPPSVAIGFEEIQRQFGGLMQADRATLALTGALTLLASALTVIPLYMLARSRLPARTSWAAAVFWPVLPSVILFEPLADTAYPLLSTTALALAALATRRPAEPDRRPVAMGAWALAVAAGLVLALGMQFTLAFLPVGLLVGLVVATASGLEYRRRAGLILAIGLGFLGGTFVVWACTRANPWVIWWWNQKNHARFYVEYHRTYGPWVIANIVELSVGLGLAVATWAIAGLAADARSVPREAWLTLGILAFLTVSGRNLGEVGRLWMILMPPLLTASAVGLQRFGGGSTTLAVSTLLQGIQILVLQATIQVVYPVV
jgi:hypothetical protein